MAPKNKSRHELRNLAPLDLIRPFPQGLFREHAEADLSKTFQEVARGGLPNYVFVTCLTTKTGQPHMHCVVLPWPLRDTPEDADLAKGD